MKNSFIPAILILAILAFVTVADAADKTNEIVRTVLTGKVGQSIKSSKFVPASDSEAAYYEAKMVDGLEQPHTVRVYVDASKKPIRLISLTEVMTAEDGKTGTGRTFTEFWEVSAGIDGQVIEVRQAEKFEDLRTVKPTYSWATDTGKAFGAMWQDYHDDLMAKLANRLYATQN